MRDDVHCHVTEPQRTTTQDDVRHLAELKAILDAEGSDYAE